MPGKRRTLFILKCYNLFVCLLDHGGLAPSPLQCISFKWPLNLAMQQKYLKTHSNAAKILKNTSLTFAANTVNTFFWKDKPGQQKTIVHDLEFETKIKTIITNQAIKTSAIQGTFVCTSFENSVGTSTLESPYFPPPDHS